MDVHLGYRTKNNSIPGSDDVIALPNAECPVASTGKNNLLQKNKSKTLQKTKVNHCEKPNHFCEFH